MTTPVIVKMSGDYADEFDLEGLWITTLEKWQEHIDNLQNFSFPHESSFGSNEYVIYETPEDYLNYFKVTIVADEFAQTLKDILGLKYTDKFGLIPLIE